MSAAAKRSKAGSGRAGRVADQIRQVLSDVLLAGNLHDPRLSNAVITRVWTSEDVQLARVYLRFFDVVGEPTAERKEGLLRALRGAKQRLQSAVAKQLKLRRTPELSFFWDAELEQVRHVDALLGTLEEGAMETRE